MAKKSELSLTRSAIKSLWSHIGITSWLDLLKQHKREHSFVRIGNDKLRGLCLDPKHHDTSPSFYIDVERGFAKCYGSSCGCYESDPVRLMAMITGNTLGETLKYVVNTFKPPHLSAKSVDKFEKARRHQEMKRQIFEASRQLTQIAIQDPQSQDSAWATTSLHWLSQKRNIPLDVLYALPVAVMPPVQRLEETLIHLYALQQQAWLSAPPLLRGETPVDHSSAAIKYMAEAYKSGMEGAVMLPLYATPTEISRLKLRVPDANVGDPKKIYIIDDEYDDGLGLFGLNWGPYANLLSKHSDVREVVVTEGEFDVLSVMTQLFVQNIEPTIAIVSAGGNGGAQDIEPVLENLGVTQAYFVGDAPDKMGDEVVQTWLKHIKKVPVRIFSNWEELAPAKDLDDAVNTQSVGLVKLLEVISPRNTDSYASIWRWLVDLLIPKIAELPTDDTRAKIDLVADAVLLVNNAVERRQFTEVIAAECGLSASLIQREATTRNDTPASFIIRLADAISEIMQVHSTKIEGGSRVLTFYNVQRKGFHHITLDSERSVIQELAPVTGVLHTFIEEHVGWPPFLERLNDADAATYKSVDACLRTYCRDAILYLAKGAIDINLDRKYRQGYHRIERIGGEVVEVYVCGTDVFRIIREGREVTYHLLQSPVYKDLVFDVGLSNSLDAKPWFPGGLSVEILDRQSKANLKNLFDDLFKMYSEAFLFRDHTLTCQMIAASIMCFPIMGAFFRPTVWYLTGDTQSGKSSFVSTLSPVGATGMRLLWCSQGNDNYTAAAVARNMDGDGRLMILDEFENNDESKKIHTQAILGIIRNLVTGQASRELCITSGTNTAGTTRQHISLPVILSGIQGAELLQDLNRLVTIHTEKSPYKENPHNTMRAAVTEDRLNQIRLELNAGMVAYAEELREISEDIRLNYSKMCARLKVQADERWATGIIPAMAVMKFIGMDHEAFFKDYVETQKYTIKRLAADSESAVTLNSIMHNPVIKQVEGPNISVAQLLVTPERRAEVNSANKGLYYDADTQQLLFLAPSVYTLLPGNLRRTLTTAHQVRTVLERHTCAIKPQAIQESGILKRIVAKMGANITLNDVIVMDVSSWLQAPREYEQIEEVSHARDPKLEGLNTADNPTPKALIGLASDDEDEKPWGNEGS